MATPNYTSAVSRKKTTTAAELLRNLRIEQGHSLRTTASKVGLNPSYLSRIERGERNLTEDLGKRLANYYGINADVVMMHEGQIPEDIVAILQNHPELIDQLRERFRD